MRIVLLICVSVLTINAGFAVEKNTQLFSNILPYAELSSAIYEKPRVLKKVADRHGFAFEFVDTIPGIEISYAVLSRKATSPDTKPQKIIVIRGTANAENAVVDMDFKLIPDKISGIEIHQGFKDATTPIYQRLKQKLDKTTAIVTTGHSLGGAAAVVLAMQLKKQGFNIDSVITFGQPKVTNVGGSSQFEDLNILRIVNPKDPVPVLPALDPLDIKNIHVYWHSGIEIILLGNNQYAFLKGIKSMMRGGEFLSYVPDQTNIESHYMQTYLQRIKQNVDKAEKVNYTVSLNFGSLLGVE